MNITYEEFIDAIFRAYDQGYARGLAAAQKPYSPNPWVQPTVIWSGGNGKSHTIPNYDSGMASGLSYMSDPYTETR